MEHIQVKNKSKLWYKDMILEDKNKKNIAKVLNQNCKEDL